MRLWLPYFGLSVLAVAALFGTIYLLSKVAAKARARREAREMLEVPWTAYQRPNQLGDIVTGIERKASNGRVLESVPFGPPLATESPTYEIELALQEARRRADTFNGSGS